MRAPVVALSGRGVDVGSGVVGVGIDERVVSVVSLLAQETNRRTISNSQRQER
jgi:hypothetical protein